MKVAVGQSGVDVVRLLFRAPDNVTSLLDANLDGKDVSLLIHTVRHGEGLGFCYIQIYIYAEASGCDYKGLCDLL